MPTPDIVEHLHPLPVCGFDAHSPHAPHCAGLGPLVACGRIIDPQHPGYGMALCWHRDPAVVPAPPPPTPPTPTPPVPTPPTVTGGISSPGGGSAPPGGSGVGTGAPGGGASSSSGGGGSTGTSTPSPPSTPEPPVDPPPDPAWCWWLKYWWLVPLLLLLLFVLGLLYKALKWLGILGLLKDLLARLWELLNGFLADRPRTVPDPPPETEPPEKPAEDSPEDEAENDEEQHACELLGVPSISFTPGGWQIVAPDCRPGLIHLANEFKMEASFSGDCHCCEYSQEIKGHVYVKRRGSDYWVKVDTVIAGGALLDPEEFRLDGKPGFAYGRRHGQINIYEDSYWPDPRESGCRYEGRDMPGLRNLSLFDSVVIWVTFRGRVIDRCTGLVKWEQEWTLKTHGQIDLEIHFPYVGTSIYVYKKLY